MNIRRSFARTPRLAIGASCLALMVAACNRQPTATEAPMVAPPAAALPLAAGAPPPAAPAPLAAALPAPPVPVRYAPQAPRESYGYIDQAYSMGQAFAGTPPDYAVDYQGTRPWIWRAGDGAYRIMERLPQGERFFYYYPGQDYPFLVQDPNYSYAYANGALVSVYGPNGAVLGEILARQRAEEAARYLYRARELYRAAQYQQREAAYASAWADRQQLIRRQYGVWQQQQAQNADWRAWHDAHQAQEQQRWRQERNQRVAYAAAIGVAVASPRAAPPNPTVVAQRQATYFAQWNKARGTPPAAQPARALRANAPAPVPKTAPPVAVSVAKQATPAAAQVQGARAQRQAAAAARANAAQAAQAQRQAARAQRQEAAAAQVKAAQAAEAQKLAAQAKQHEAAAAQAKSAQAARAEKAAAEAKQRQAAAAQARAARAAQAQKSAGEAKQRGAAAAQAKAAQAKKLAAQAQRPKPNKNEAAGKKPNKPNKEKRQQPQQQQP